MRVLKRIRESGGSARTAFIEGLRFFQNKLTSIMTS
jgi:hypothetical protein